MRFLFWSMSLLILIGWGSARILHPGNMDFPHHFFLLKYAGDIAFFNFAILMFISPFLIQKRVISSNYHGENKIGQAKTILVIYTILFPGIILLCIAGILAGIVPFAVILILFLYMYLKNAYIFFKEYGTDPN